MRKLLLLLPILFISACTTTRPDRFLTVNEMFGTEAKPPAGMSDAVKKNVFEASYAEVFRAATVSASQAQFNVESDDRKKGRILATRTVMQQPIGTSPNMPTQHVFFFDISLKELGPKKTEISIAAKVQGRCMSESTALLGCLTLGILVPWSMDRNERCENLSAGIWAAGDYAAGQDIGNFLTFVRNNLIAANAI
jgi:hypothetical protein